MAAPISKTPKIDAAKVADTILSKWDSIKNDKTWFSGWDMKPHVSRTVLNVAESRKVLKDITALPKAQAKQVLQAIAQRVKEGGVGGVAMTPGAQKLWAAAAEKLGIKADWNNTNPPPMVLG